MKEEALRCIRSALVLGQSFEYIKGMLALAMVLKLITEDEMVLILHKNFPN